MTTLNLFENGIRVSTTPKDVAAESSGIKRELTDQEIASVTGGVATSGAHYSSGSTNTIPSLGGSAA